MTNKLEIFKSKEFGEVRTVLIDDEPYFVGKDVAEILGYRNPRDAINNHVDDEDKGGSETRHPWWMSGFNRNQRERTLQLGDIKQAAASESF